MKKRIKTAIGIPVIILLLTILTGCYDYFACIEGNGKTVKETRYPGQFHAIHILGSFDVEIINDTFTEVIVQADENLIPNIITRVNSGILIVKTRDNTCFRDPEPVRVIVRTGYIDELNIYGSGDFYAGDIKASDLELNIYGSGDMDLTIDVQSVDINIAGSGDVKLKGHTVNSDINITGSGNIRSFGLYQEKCFVDISGSGSVYVYVNKLLDVDISGSGSVFYKGDPVVYTDITGSGSVIKY